MVAVFANTVTQFNDTSADFCESLRVSDRRRDYVDAVAMCHLAEWEERANGIWVSILQRMIDSIETVSEIQYIDIDIFDNTSRESFINK
jgi:hypothetical protein